MPTDFERGAKVAGSKFYFTVGEDARQEMALVDTMMRFHQARGYTPVIPPYLIRRQTAEWAGILPRFEGDFYETTDGMVLIPTAETPMVGLHADEIIPESDLPLKYVAFSPCFRREAGAGGKRDAGLRRVHQFHKVELFVICKPEDSGRLHAEMVEQVASLLDTLNVRHRRVELSEGDRSPVSAKTTDIEVACGDEWLEVSSISNTLDRQSRLRHLHRIAPWFTTRCRTRATSICSGTSTTSRPCRRNGTTARRRGKSAVVGSDLLMIARYLENEATLRA